MLPPPLYLFSVCTLANETTRLSGSEIETLNVAFYCVSRRMHSKYTRNSFYLFTVGDWRRQCRQHRSNDTTHGFLPSLQKPNAPTTGTRWKVAIEERILSIRLFGTAIVDSELSHHFNWCKHHYYVRQFMVTHVANFSNYYRIKTQFIWIFMRIIRRQFGTVWRNVDCYHLPFAAATVKSFDFLSMIIWALANWQWHCGENGESQVIVQFH